MLPPIRISPQGSNDILHFASQMDAKQNILKGYGRAVASFYSADSGGQKSDSVLQFFVEIKGDVEICPTVRELRVQSHSGRRCHLRFQCYSASVKNTSVRLFIKEGGEVLGHEVFDIACKGRETGHGGEGSHRRAEGVFTSSDEGASASPPKVKNVRFEKKDGKLIAAWDRPKWPSRLRYTGKCTESGGKQRVVDEFSGITETSYEMFNISPVQDYITTVWAGDVTGQAGPEARSEPDMLCKKLSEKVYVDDTTQLRAGCEVYKGYWLDATDAPKPVAVKIVDGDEAPREVQSLKKVKDRNVVVYKHSGNIPRGGSFGKKTYIVSELCRDKTFSDLVLRQSCPMLFYKRSLLHMMLGVHALHEYGILHRDLKPENLLWSLDGSTMKVADFGLCKEMCRGKSKVSKSLREVGTDGWGSPEYYGKNAHMSSKSDIFSAGLIIAFSLSRGKHVYGSDDEAHKWKNRILDDDYEPDLSHLACENAEIARDLIDWMLQRDPDMRPTAEEVLKHPYFWSDERKLEFLHRMKDFFLPFFFKQSIPEETTRQIMESLDRQSSLIQTSRGEKNWLKKMEEAGVEILHTSVVEAARVKRYKYNYTSVFDLIRFIRNIDEHCWDNKHLRQDCDSVSELWKISLKCAVYNAIRQKWNDAEDGWKKDVPPRAFKFFTDVAIFENLPAVNRCC